MGTLWFAGWVVIAAGVTTGVAGGVLGALPPPPPQPSRYIMHNDSTGRNRAFGRQRENHNMDTPPVRRIIVEVKKVEEKKLEEK
jgi:hypothetical protein